MATEWAPTSLAERAGALYFLSVALVIAVLVRVGPPRPADGLRVLAFGLLALVAVRSVLWWGLVQALPLAWGLARGTSPPAPSRRGEGRRTRGGGAGGSGNS